MTNDPANRLIDQLIRCVLPGDGEGQADGDLLTRFVERRDEAAFNVLVRRHGTMVWGVCVRALHNQHDAEDAFQATFLVLVRKAATVIPREMVGNWLYGVAHQVTLQARRVIARRRASAARKASHSSDTCTSSGVQTIAPRRVTLPSSSTSRSRRPSRHRRVPSRSSFAEFERSPGGRGLRVRRSPESSACVARSRS